MTSHIVYSISGCTSHDGPSKAELQAVGNSLGWRYTAVFDHTCTHLVSDSVTSEKYATALRRKVPIVHPAWVTESANSHGPLPEAAYLLPPFYQLKIVVTGSGFSQQVREHMRSTLMQLGGTLTGQLSGDCTHLVAESAQSTEKLQAVCSGAPGLKDVKVVSCAWLEACMRLGTYVNEQPYLMARREPCLAACVYTIARNSASPDQLKAMSRASANVGASRSERVGATVTHVLFGDHACADPLSFATVASALTAGAPGAVLVSADWLTECDRNGKVVPVEQFLWRHLVDQARAQQPPAAASSSNAAAPSHAAEPHAWRPGGNHAAQQHHAHHSYHPAVSSHQPHVSSHQQPPAQPAPAAAAAAPYPVAAASSSRAPAALERRNSAERPSSRGPAPLERRNSGSGGGAASSSRLGRTSSRGYFEGFTLLQVMTSAIGTGDEMLSKALRDAQTYGSLRLLCDSSVGDLDEWMSHEGPAAVLAPQGPDGLRAAKQRAQELHAARLRQRGIDPNDHVRQQLERAASSQQGGGNEEDDIAERFGEGGHHPPCAVTLQWLLGCVRARKCLSPSRHPIYTPCQSRLPLADFKELSFSISQYDVNSEERRLAIDVIKLLGGKYRESFSRNRSHLVCSRISGEKCEKAQEWGVPMVTAAWLRDCFESGCAVPITDAHRPKLPDPSENPAARPGSAGPPMRPASAGIIADERSTDAYHGEDDERSRDGNAISPPNLIGEVNAATFKVSPPPKSKEPQPATRPTEMANPPPGPELGGGGGSSSAAGAPPPARLSARPAMGLRPGFLSSAAPAPASSRQPSSINNAAANIAANAANLGPRSSTVADAEALIAQLPTDANPLDGCTKAPARNPNAGSSGAIIEAAGRGSLRRPLRRAELEQPQHGNGANDVTTYNDFPAASQEVRYIDPEQRELQQRMRSRMLADSPVRDEAAADEGGGRALRGPPAQQQQQQPQSSQDSDYGALMDCDDEEDEELIGAQPPPPQPARAHCATASVAASGRAAPTAPSSNIFASAIAGRGAAGERKNPLVGKVIAVIGSGSKAKALTQKARNLGASVVELRGGGADGQPMPMPIDCSIAVFVSLNDVCESFESLAALAAGLYPLKPSFLESISPSARSPPEQTKHEYEASGPARSLLNFARKQRDRSKRLFEGMKVTLRMGDGTTNGEEEETVSLLDGNNRVRFSLSGSEVRALLSSGGAKLTEPSDTQADYVLVQNADDLSADVLRGRPCHLLSEWMKCLVGEVEPERIPYVEKPREQAGGGGGAGTSRASSQGEAPAGGHRGPGGGDGGQGGNKRRTRHSAAPEKPAAGKRQRA